MKYLGNHSDYENSNNRTGVLLVNLGTPERPVCPGLRDYLSEFLMDPRVIELPALFRTLLVRGIIVNFRSHKSAAAYREVWTENGSPLMFNTQGLVNKTQEVLGEDFYVVMGMRYGKPSIASALKKLHEQGIRKIVVIPLYPQYSGSTNGSTFDALGKALSKQRWVPDIRFVSDYYQNLLYTQAIGNSIKEHWQQYGRKQKLIMSFHGVPKKYITKGDPYKDQCLQSSQAIADHLELNDDDWMVVFQSRLGAQEWLKPYCDETLKTLPSEGVKSVDIICPGFSADCLETLEEIEGENKEYFIAAGGKEYSYIPCLNDSEAHAELMADIVKDGR